MIKFRVWDKDYKEMYGPKDDIIITFLGGKVSVADISTITGACDGINNFTLMQSTGLTDIDGTEIYEGDIVTAMSQGVKGTGVVKQRIDGYWLMYPAWKNGISWELSPDKNGKTTVEVIGNIYENKVGLWND